MSAKSQLTRTLVAIAGALVMSTVAVSAAVDPAAGPRRHGAGAAQCLSSKSSKPRSRSAPRGW